MNIVVEQCVYMHTSAENYAKTFFKHSTRKICFTFKHLVDCTEVYKNLVEKKSNLSSIKVRSHGNLYLFLITYHKLNKNMIKYQ